MSLERPLDNIVGSASEQAKQQRKKTAAHEAAGQESAQKRLEQFERPKTEEEKRTIQFVDEKTAAVLRRYVIERRRFLEHAVHVVTKKGWKDLFEKSQAAYVDAFSVVVKDRKWTKVGFLHVLAHEAFHIKSYRAEQMDRVNEGTVRRQQYREGLMVFPRQTSRKNPKQGEDLEQVFFEWLNEAVVQELTQRLIEEVLRDPPEWLREEARAVLAGREEIAPTPEHIPFEEKKILGLFHSVKWGVIYQEERVRFWEIVEKVYETHRSEFQSREDVFRVFVEAAFEGYLMRLGRLIEETFEKGSFRKLGGENI